MYVKRENGVIKCVYANPQDFETEYIADDDSELVEFFSTPPVIDPIADLQQQITDLKDQLAQVKSLPDISVALQSVQMSKL